MIIQVETIKYIFIKYTVQINNSVYIYHELINNELVYSQADYDDIDEFGILVSTVKRYLIEEVQGNTGYNITLPTISDYSYKELLNSKIKLLPPVALDNSTFWHVRVTNGEFISSNNKYYLPEYNTQSFSPFPPYKSQVEQKAIYITNKIIYVPKNIVYDPSLGLYTDIIIKDKNRDIKYVYTNDLQKVDTSYNSSFDYDAGILSINQLNGFIELQDKIRDDDLIYVNYFTEEDEFEFIDVNFNPIQNIDILNQYVVLYLNPQSIYTGELTKTLHYLLVNKLGEITYSSQATEGFIDSSSLKLRSEDFNVDGSPSHTFYYNNQSTPSGLFYYLPSGFYNAYRDEISFVDKYTTESILTSINSVPSGMSLKNQQDNPQFLILGDIFVGENQSPDEYSLFDTRMEGGGIKEDLFTEALLKEPEVQFVTNAVSKRQYPSAGAFYVEVPHTLLQENGGAFTYDQIKNVIEKHMAFGNYPIVRTYGINPVIIVKTESTTSCIITWPSYSSTVTYNVYYSKYIDNNFVLSNLSEITDVASNNIYTITSLITRTKYYTYIEAIKDSISSYGPTISFTTI